MALTLPKAGKLAKTQEGFRTDVAKTRPSHWQIFSMRRSRRPASLFQRIAIDALLQIAFVQIISRSTAGSYGKDGPWTGLVTQRANMRVNKTRRDKQSEEYGLGNL